MTKEEKRKMSNLQHSSTVSDTIYGKNVKDHDVSTDNIKHETTIENNEIDNIAITNVIKSSLNHQLELRNVIPYIMN